MVFQPFDQPDVRKGKRSTALKRQPDSGALLRLRGRQKCKSEASARCNSCFHNGEISHKHFDSQSPCFPASEVDIRKYWQPGYFVTGV